VTFTGREIACILDIATVFCVLSCVTQILADTKYNNDPRADIAFYNPAGGWGSVPTLLANGDGSWNPLTSGAPAWANQQGVNGVPGDYNGDGKTGIAFYCPGCG